MRRNRKVNLFVIALLACIGLAGIKIYSTHAEDKSGIFDQLFAGDQYTVYIENEILNSEQLESLVRSSLPFRIYEHDAQTSESTSYLEIGLLECDYDSLTCNIGLDRYFMPSWGQERVKDYENVQIIVDSNIDQFFPMLTGGVLEINYPESLFVSEEEKANYVSDYVSKYNEWDSNTQTSTSYQYDNTNGKIVYSVTKDNVQIRNIEKDISDIVFDPAEGEYSDDFKKLTSGTLTIKTDMELSKEVVQAYVSSYGFNVEGNINNNKAFISLSKWNGETNDVEKHLVDLVRDSAIDLEIFSRVGLEQYISIPANTPEEADYSNNTQSYVSSYNNLNLYNYDDDNISEDIHSSCGYNVFDSENCYTTYTKRTRYGGNVLDVQVHKTPVRFTGYVESVSENYSNYIGNEIVVNADSIDEYEISSSLPNTHGFTKRVMICNQDKTLCDIALRDDDSREIEIHPVAIRQDSSISDDFKMAFNLNNDNSLDILTDARVNVEDFYLYFNGNSGVSLAVQGNKLIMQDYVKGIRETHRVNINLVSNEASAEFNSLIKANAEVYPGETNSDGLWENNIRNQKKLFTEQVSNGNISVHKCNSEDRACAVAFLNSDNKIEIHNTNIILKDGKRPRYSEAFPSDTIAIGAINTNDANLVSDAARAYFLGKKNVDAYLSNYSNGTAKVVLDWLETHTANIELINEEDTEARSAVDEAIAKLESEGRLSFEQTDLEYVNGFYYGSFSASGWDTMNFNSRRVQDKLTSIIGNNHISYYFASGNGGGSYYSEGMGGRILLYYDGVAYGETETPIVFNRNHIIYIPDDTLDSPEGYIEAAQKRVDDYLGSDSGVLISYGGEVSAELDPSWYDIDEDNFDGNDYIISRGGSEQRILIVKDSSKMQEASFVANDVYNNVTVSSDDANYPTDTVVSSDKQDTSSPLIRRWLEMLGLDDASIIDINLFSPSIGLIKDFSGVDFDVQLPIDWNKFKSKNLYAYYISDDGKIEEHPITYGGFFGRFKTGHFSTYIISEKIDDKVIEDINNPGTRDNGMKYVVVFAISATGVTMATSGVYIAKKKRQANSTTV